MPKPSHRPRRDAIGATAILTPYTLDPTVRKHELLTLQLPIDVDIAATLRDETNLNVTDLLRVLIDFWPERVPLHAGAEIPPPHG